MANGGGGQPGTVTSTGRTAPAPPADAKLGPNTPPKIAQAPMAKTRFGSGMASYALMRGIRIASETGPETIRTSAFLGVGVMKNPSRCIL